VRLVKDLTPSPPVAAPTRYTIAVTRDGAVHLHNAPHSDAMVVKELRAAVSTGAQVEVVLAIDKDVPHGRAVAVMDLVRAAGVTRLSLAMQPAH
jgi:biopolymer transport protein ExbD